MKRTLLFVQKTDKPHEKAHYKKLQGNYLRLLVFWVFYFSKKHISKSVKLIKFIRNKKIEKCFKTRTDKEEIIHLIVYFNVNNNPINNQ